MAKKKKNEVGVVVTGMTNTQKGEPITVLPTSQEKEVRGKTGLLISVVDYPTIIKYGGATIRLTGRATEKVLNSDKLQSPLPLGVKLKLI